MNCPHGGEELVDLLYGELTGRARAELLSHLAKCPQCADEFAALRLAGAALDHLTAQEPPLPILAMGPAREIPRATGCAPHKSRWRLAAWAACAAAAVVAVVITVLLVHDGIVPAVYADDQPVQIRRLGVSLTILSRPPEWDLVGDAPSRVSQAAGLQPELPEPPPGFYRTWPGLALVRDQRLIRHLGRGQSDVRFTGVPSGIWPDSVRLCGLDGGDGLKILEQNYQYDLASAAAVLDKHIDNEIGVLFKDGSRAQGTLLSFDDRTLIIQPAGEGPRSIARAEVAAVVFEKLPQGLLTTPTLLWRLDNAAAVEQQFEVDYLTTGLSWRADYVIKLRPAQEPLSDRERGRGEIVDWADLVGYATVTNNSGVTYEDAQLKLMAGDANLLMRPYLFVMYGGINGIIDGPRSGRAEPQMIEKSFFEYHLYTLTRPTTIADNETKQLEMVSGAGLPMRRGYIYDPAANPTAARVVSEVENTEANGLGKPLPKGVVRLYAPDPEGVETYVSQTEIDHTPVKEKLRLLWGFAFDIACNWRETNTRYVGYENHVTAECSLRNHKNYDVTVTVIVHVPPSTYAARCELPWHVREVGLVEVTAHVPANSETKFTFSYDWNNISGGGLHSRESGRGDE